MLNQMDVLEQVTEIRVATPQEYPVVKRLFAKLHQYNSELDPLFELSEEWEKVLREHLERTAANGRGIAFLAWHNELPVGLIMMAGHTDSPLFKHRQWAELLALYVEPAARGTSTANDLLQAGVEWAHEHGYERVQLYVTASNERAKQFYRRTGFEPVQEIWRLGIEPAEEVPQDDPVCESSYAQGEHLLSAHTPSLTPEEDECDKKC